MRTDRARALAAALALASPAAGEGEPPGGHDHYVLALSWQPAWCALEGDARGAASCEEAGLGWTLHGLWPQYEEGWPSWCPAERAGPTAREVGAMAEIMGSPTLAGHQWRKHGTCSGLSGADYLALSRLAYERVSRPGVLRRIEAPMRIPATVVEEAFLEANPEMEPDGVTITCRDGRILEARICLTRELEPRPCAGRAARDCTLPDPRFEPLR
jgi:ribonuclease T2